MQCNASNTKLMTEDILKRKSFERTFKQMCEKYFNFKFNSNKRIRKSIKSVL